MSPNKIESSPQGSRLWQPTRRELIIATAATGFGIAVNKIINRFAHGDHGNGGHMRGYSRQEVEEHVHTSRKVWKPAGEIIDKEQKSCIDGREDQCVISTPGGDMGDSLMELAALEQTTGKEFTQDELDSVFGRILDRHEGLFYMHSDQHTLELIAAELHVSTQEAEDLLENPGSRRTEVLRVVLRRIGCGHLGGMAAVAAAYPGIRPGLIEGLMRAYWNRKWDNNRRIDHRILQGGHNEGAILILQGASHRDTELPLLQPQVRTEHGNSSLFVVHQPIEILSEQEFLRDASDLARIPRRDIPMQDLARTLRTNRQQYLESSRERLAPHHPIFRAQIDARRRISLIA